MTDADPTLSRIDPDATLLRRSVVKAAAPPILHVLLLAEPGRPTDAGDRARILRFPLSANLRIGRVAGNDIVLPAAEVSRSHCTLSLVGGRAILADLGSTNGTFVEGRRVTDPVALSDDSLIAVGPFTLAYRCGTAEQLGRAESLEQELRRATAYVQAVLPAPVTSGPTRVAWRFLPSTSVGGDGFGYQRLPDGRFCVWLIDVNGHGVGSALLAVSVMNLLRQPALPGADLGDPAAVLAALNGMFQMDRHGGLCLTAWYGVFDPATRTLRFASAGQHPAYLLAGGAPQPLQTRSVMLGVTERFPFRADSAAVPPGSRLHLFSDGAFETTAADGTQRRLADFLPLLARPLPGPAAPDSLPEPERLLQAIRALSRPGPFDDDISLVVVDLD